LKARVETKCQREPGHELFFLGLDQRIRTVEYTVDGNSFSPGKLRVWSEKRVADLGVNSAYDLAPFSASQDCRRRSPPSDWRLSVDDQALAPAGS
jgi:hypothetical protein